MTGNGWPFRRSWLLTSPTRMAVVYLLCGAAWILGSDLILGMFVRDAEPLTRLQIYKGWAYVTVTGILLYALITQMLGLLRRRERALANVMETASEGIAVLDQDNAITTANHRLCAFFDRDEASLIGTSLLDHVDDQSRGALQHLLNNVRAGAPGQADVCIHMADGNERWAIAAASPANHRPGEVLVMLTDITQRKQTEEALRQSLDSQRRMLHELNHRVRNNLTSLIAMIETAVPQTSSVEHFASSMAGRLQAMASVHTLLSQSKWSPQPLARIIEELTPARIRSRVEKQGPAVNIPSAQIGALALVLHELLVNSTKHGAASVPDGRVFIRWSSSAGDASPAGEDTGAGKGDAGDLDIEWIEQGGPPIESQPTPGYGTSLIEGLVEFDLQGSVELAYTREGVHHRMRIGLQQSETADQSSFADVGA